MFDFIVVGSGAGGATIAKELSTANKRVLILESGTDLPASSASKSYKIMPSGVEVWQANCLGGTTTVSMGNAVRGHRKGLDEYFREAEGELGVTLVPDSHIGHGTRLLFSASSDWNLMPKAIDFSRCKPCGMCPLGCPNQARWDATLYVKQAKSCGGHLLTGLPVSRVLVERGKAVGVETADGKTFQGRVIIISAGSIETPRILMRSGIEGVGSGLYVDTYVTVGGLMKGVGLNSELNMALFIKRDGYLLSPHYSSFLVPYLSSKGIKALPSDVLGIMVKIADEPTGVVERDRVIKDLSNKDAGLLERGKKEAEDLLIRAGVNPENIVCTYPRGAHPGGTCASLVKNFEPVLESLYISDASIIPGPLGIPPILTIIAMSKKIAAILMGKA